MGRVSTSRCNNRHRRHEYNRQHNRSLTLTNYLWTTLQCGPTEGSEYVTDIIVRYFPKGTSWIPFFNLFTAFASISDSYRKSYCRWNIECTKAFQHPVLSVERFREKFIILRSIWILFIKREEEWMSTEEWNALDLNRPLIDINVVLNCGNGRACVTQSSSSFTKTERFLWKTN